MKPYVVYEGEHSLCEFIHGDLRKELDTMVVALLPLTLRPGSAMARSVRTWVVIVAPKEDMPMLNVFSFTDEKRRTFEWGLDHDDRDETVITCKVGQSYSTTVQGPDGQALTKGQILYGEGRGSTAQIAYDQALANLTAEMRKAAADPSKLLDQVKETRDVVPPDRPLFGKEEQSNAVS